MDADKKNVALLGTTSFFNDFSSESVFSLLALYASSPSLVGLLGGIVNGLGSIFKLLFGYMSDKINQRKPMVFAGYLTSALSKFSLPFVGQSGMAVPLITDRIGKGIRTSPRDAILAGAKNKGWAFGWHRALDTLGAVGGSVFAYLLINNGGDYGRAMLIAAAVGFLSLIPIIFVNEPKKARAWKKSEGGFWKSISHSPGKLKRFLLPVGLFSTALVSPMIFIRSVSDFLGVASLLIYTCFNIIYAVSARRLGALSDKVGRKRVLMGSMLTAALTFLLMSLGGRWMVAGFMTYGLAVGAFHSTAVATASEFAGGSATGIGMYHMVTGLAVFGGSSLIGTLLQNYGNTAYLLCTVVSLAAIGSLAGVAMKSPSAS